MMRILMLPGCDVGALRSARDDIGTSSPEMHTGASDLAAGLGRKDILRIDWHGVQIVHSGMGASIASGFEPVRVRAEIVRILDAAIASGKPFDQSDPMIRDMAGMSRYALMTHPERADVPSGSTVAVSPSPMIRAFCYARDTFGRILPTADQETIRRWMPDLPECVVIRSSLRDDGVARIVMEPLAGYLPIEPIDAVETLRLHSRFGS